MTSVLHQIPLEVIEAVKGKPGTYTHYISFSVDKNNEYSWVSDGLRDESLELKTYFYSFTYQQPGALSYTAEVNVCGTELTALSPDEFMHALVKTHVPPEAIQSVRFLALNTL